MIVQICRLAILQTLLMPLMLNEPFYAPAKVIQGTIRGPRAFALLSSVMSNILTQHNRLLDHPKEKISQTISRHRVLHVFENVIPILQELFRVCRVVPPATSIATNRGN